MNPAATIANTLWAVTNLPAYLRFHRALRQPEATQLGRLQDFLRRNAQTVFGSAHDFESIRTHQEFASRVPLMTYEELEPWIQRIRVGEQNVLTREPVTRLIPTSGSSGARKLIPFTAGLQREFNSAIGAWLADLLRSSPGIAGGPAYWSVTPGADFAGDENSVVPVGFDTDTAYLGGAREQLARAIMAVPAELRLVRDMEVFRYVTALCLLRERDLRLISVWHPSFLTLLLDSISVNWSELVEDIYSGGCKHAAELPPAVRVALRLRPMRRRAEELRACDPRRPETFWPHLKVISCWGDASAESAMAGLKELILKTLIQSKGLLATEAFVTIPFAGLRPVAVRSHFFEFLDDSGAIHLTHELREGCTYEVIVTTAGGLWRYRLRDRVQVTGLIGRTPSLRFLGRSGNVSDLFGEKLSEAFVAQAIREALAGEASVPRFILLAPDTDASGSRYTLYVEGATPGALAEKLDRVLRANPHYAYCRDLGQLQPVCVFNISHGGYEAFANRHTALGARLGDIKPATLSRLAGWTEFFPGAYAFPRRSAS